MGKAELKVDLSLYKKHGIKILTEDDVKARKVYEGEIAFPEDELFEPEGITFEDAVNAMKLCKEM